MYIPFVNEHIPNFQNNETICYKNFYIFKTEIMNRCLCNLSTTQSDERKKNNSYLFVFTGLTVGQHLRKVTEIVHMTPATAPSYLHSTLLQNKKYLVSNWL